MKYFFSLIIITVSILTAYKGASAAVPMPATRSFDRFELAQQQVTPIPPPSPTPTVTPLALTTTPASTASITSTTRISVTSVAQPSVTAEVIVAALNVRQGPGLNYAVVKTALAGNTYEVTGRDTSGNWLQINEPAAGLAWISGGTAFTRLANGSVAELPIVQAPAASTGLPPAVAGGSVPNPVGNPSPAGNSGGPAPGGSRLIFATRSGGDLYVVNADGSGLRLLAQGVIDPVVSPDGRQVAFTRWDGAEIGTLFVANVDGSGERVVVGDIRQPKSPTWSPDGQKIVISFQHGGIVDPDEECRKYDRGERVRIPERATITNFHTNSDGSVELCFIRIEDLQWMLREVELASGSFEDLASDEYAFNPTWDPNSPWRVIYDGNKGLMQFDVTNGSQWPVTEDVRDTGPVFSPDGQSLALTYKQHDHWEVYTLDLATGARLRLTKPPILADPQYNSAAPAWSPDGSELAFVTDRNGPWEIWVMKADGSQPRPLLPLEIQIQLGIEYHGVNERLLNWIE